MLVQDDNRGAAKSKVPRVGEIDVDQLVDIRSGRNCSGPAQCKAGMHQTLCLSAPVGEIEVDLVHGWKKLARTANAKSAGNGQPLEAVD